MNPATIVTPYGESVTCFIVWELPTRVDCTWLNEESETTFTTSLQTSAYDRLDLPGAMDIRGLSHMYRYFESDAFFAFDRITSRDDSQVRVFLQSGPLDIIRKPV